MRFKKLIAAISAAAMLLPALPIAQAATKNADVTITGAAVVRSTAQDFLTMNGTTATVANVTDEITVFSNSTASYGGSQCGAYYQYEIPEYNGENEAVTLSLTNSRTATDTLHIIAVGTENAGKADSGTYTKENVFKDVSAAYTAAEKTIIDVGAAVNNVYTVDITSLSQKGTNAIFVYSDAMDDNSSNARFYHVKNASISMTYDTLPTVVWRASDTSWSLSSGDRINGYANVSNGELTTTMVADNETSNYSGDVKTAFDSSSYHGAAPAVNANCNIMGMIATAGSADNYLFRAGTKYTLHYTLSGTWTNKVTNTPNGAYLNLSTWTNASTRKENLTNLNVTSTSAGVPLTKTQDFTPSVDCYAQFNFELRRVSAGDTMTVSNVYVTTEQAETATPTPTAEPTATPAGTPKPEVTVEPAEGRVWSKQWSYDFNDYTDTTEYSSSNKKITLSDVYPKQAPSIIWNKGTLSSANGIYGKSDNCLEIKSEAAAGEPARTLYRLENLGCIDDKNEYTAETENAQFSTTVERKYVDDSVKCLVASMKIAFSNTNEDHYVGSYRIIGTAYNGILFEKGGKIKYHNNNLQYVDTQKTYNAGEWYNVVVKYDFENSAIVYYLDGAELARHDMPQKGSDARYQFEEISVKSRMNADDPGITYLDDLALYKQEDANESHLTAQITSPEKTTYLTGDTVKFYGKVNDGLNNEAAPTTVISLDGTEIQTVNTNTYKIDKSDIQAGHHTIKAVSTTAQNRSITKELSFDVANYAMPSTYANGMVLQRNKELTVAGLGVNGKEISVTLNGATKTAIAYIGRKRLLC